MTERQIAALNHRLNQRLTKLRNTTKVTVVVGALACLLALVYMHVLYGQFREAIAPAELAEFAANQTKLKLPGAGRAIESRLHAQAPEIVQTFRNQFVAASVPLVADILRKNLLELINEFFTSAPDIINRDVYAQVLVGGEKTIKRAIKQGTLKNTNAKAMARFESQLLRDFDKRMLTEPGENLNRKLDKSLGTLSRITAALKKLGSKRRLSEDERLTKQLITVWWSAFETESLSKRDIKETKAVIRSGADQAADMPTKR